MAGRDLDFATYHKVAEQFHPEAKADLQRKADQLTERCVSILASGPIVADESLFWYGQAAVSGDPLGTARVIVRFGVGKVPDGKVAAKVNDILRSGDAEAIFALADAMGRRNVGRPDAFGPFSGANDDGAAWQLAACQMGANCSGNSPAMRTMCLRAGIIAACGSSSLPQLYRQVLYMPADFERISNRARQIALYVRDRRRSG